MSNVNRAIIVNGRHVVPLNERNNKQVNNIDLISTQRLTLPPQSVRMVTVRACGPDLHAFRPTSNIGVLMEGNPRFCDRLQVNVIPAVDFVTHQNCTKKVQLHNPTVKSVVIRKGLKVATCLNFDEYGCDGVQYVNRDVNKVTDPVNLNRDVNKVTGSVYVNNITTDPINL